MCSELPPINYNPSNSGSPKTLSSLKEKNVSIKNVSNEKKWERNRGIFPVYNTA